ncbi:MAG: T9SS type A sorting domain-containing protein [Candidatus Latescibacteria bacterium]|nr:T9SS type A sorting domain-containing protein [Candidatus Latescibacterota bacterium]
MGNHRNFYCLLLLALLAASAGAQEEWTGDTSMRQINQVLVLDGQVWNATAGGVLRFDPGQRTFERFTRLDGLAGNQVLSLAADEHGDLWFGTEGQGLSRFRLAEHRFDPPYLDFKDLRIEALVAAGGRVYVATDRGISVFLVDKEEVRETYHRLGDLAKDLQINDLVIFNGALWAATPDGVAWASLDQPNLQDPESWQTNSFLGATHTLMVQGDTLLAAANRNVFAFDPQLGRFAPDYADTLKVLGMGSFQNRAVICLQDGKFMWRTGPGEWARQTAPRFAQVTSLSQGDSALWVGSKQGLLAVGALTPPAPSEPGANQFYEMKLLDSGELWVSSVPNDFSDPHGLYQFDGTHWQIHDRSQGLPSNTLVSLETDTADRLWVGTWGQGVVIRDSTGTWQRLNQTNSILKGVPNDPNFVAISDISRDSTGLMWLANVQIGLVVMDNFPPTRSQLFENPALSLALKHDIGQVVIAPAGIKWISTETDGLILFDDGGTPFDPADDSSLLINQVYDQRLTSDRVNALLLDRSGRLWVATNSGLNAVRGTYSRASRTFRVESWRTYAAETGLPSSEINTIEQDDLGNIWVGTEGGLTRISSQGEVEFTFTKSNSLLIDNRVKSLLFDPEKRELWIGTFDGLSRLHLGEVTTPGGGSLTVYPNPFVLEGSGSTLHFAGLPLGASLRIFSLSGQLVAQLDGTPGQGTIEWRGQNQAGVLVGSGVYFFVATDEAGHSTKGKFAVVGSQ